VAVRSGIITDEDYLSPNLFCSVSSGKKVSISVMRYVF
jgi:hypothetical protein